MNPTPQIPQPPSDRSGGDGVRLWPWGLGAITVIVAALIAGAIPRISAKRKLDSRAGESRITAVLVTTASISKSGSDLQLPAEMKPFVEAVLFARASGYLKTWKTDLGARVNTGEILAEIDTPELDQELEKAKAELKRADAALGLARSTATRWSQLLKTSSVSEQDAAEKEAELALRLAAVDAVKAELRRIEETKGFAHVTAPFNGVITERKAEIGQLITSGGGRELFRIADIERLRVFVRVPQSAARAMKPGEFADLQVPEYPKRTFPAKIVRNAGAIDSATRTLLTELEVDNSKGELFAGGFAQVRFKGRTTEPLLAIPSNALIFGADGIKAAVVGKGNRVQLRRLNLGRDLGPTVEILEGIEASDQIILNPPDSIAEGQEVRVVTQAPTAIPRP